MGTVAAVPVTSRPQRKAFLEFPWQLYRNDPNWVPPLRFEQKQLVGYRPHPFYEQNRCQTFLAYREGEVCGRIAAIVNEDYIRLHHERRGFFGFFECADDPEAADALFDAAAGWLAKRDIHQLRGPASPSMNYVYGTLVDGFDTPPTIMMAYNPPYYPRLIESCGFVKAQDLYAYWGNLEMLPASSAKLGPVSEQIAERYNVKVRPMDVSRFREEVEAFLSIYNRSLTQHWGFVPLSPSEVAYVAANMRRLIAPELAVAAEIDGKLVGAVLCLPDYNPRIKRIDGRLWPFGFVRLLWNPPRSRRCGCWPPMSCRSINCSASAWCSCGRWFRPAWRGTSAKWNTRGLPNRTPARAAAWKRAAPSGLRPTACTTAGRNLGKKDASTFCSLLHDVDPS